MLPVCSRLCRTDAGQAVGKRILGNVLLGYSASLASYVALSDLERRLARLDQRIQKMETAVTDRAFDWDRRFRKG